MSAYYLYVCIGEPHSKPSIVLPYQVRFYALSGSSIQSPLPPHQLSVPVLSVCHVQNLPDDDCNPGPQVNMMVATSLQLGLPEPTFLHKLHLMVWYPFLCDLMYIVLALDAHVHSVAKDQSLSTVMLTTHPPSALPG